MDKARREFTDSYPAFGQRPVIAAGDVKDGFLIRYAGGDDAYINTSGGRKNQGVGHFRIDDEIWGHDPAVGSGIVDDVDVDVLGGNLVIQRCFAIGSHIAVGCFNDIVPSED